MEGGEQSSLPVLVAEDDDFSRRAIGIKLARWGYRVVEAADGDAATAILREPTAPRLAILDWQMPGRSGPEICRELRQERGRPYTYILLLTSRSERADIVGGLEAGADDYLTKPFDDELLELRLRAGRRIVQMQEDLVRAREDLRIRAEHDALTGIWNRGRVRTELDRRLAEARVSAPVTVVLFDLDHFKRLNDRHGHAAGDAALQAVVERARHVLRADDGFGRYGGEEFLLVLPGQDARAAERVAERVRAAIAAGPVAVGDIEVNVTASFGVATAGSGHLAADALLVRADEALYRAKQGGRDRVVVAGG